MSWLRNVINAILGRGCAGSPSQSISDEPITREVRQGCDKKIMTPKQIERHCRVECAVTGMVKYFGEHRVAQWIPNKELTNYAKEGNVEYRDILAMVSRGCLVFNNELKKRYRPFMFTQKAVDMARTASLSERQCPEQAAACDGHANEPMAGMAEYHNHINDLKGYLVHVQGKRAPNMVWGAVMYLAQGWDKWEKRYAEVREYFVSKKKYASAINVYRAATSMQIAIDLASRHSTNSRQLVIDSIIDVVPKPVVLAAISRYQGSSKDATEVLQYTKLYVRDEWGMTPNKMVDGMKRTFIIYGDNAPEWARHISGSVTPSQEAAGLHVFKGNWPEIRAMINRKGGGDATDQHC